MNKFMEKMNKSDMENLADTLEQFRKFIEIFLVQQADSYTLTDRRYLCDSVGGEDVCFDLRQIEFRLRIVVDQIHGDLERFRKEYEKNKELVKFYEEWIKK